ncbi:MAG TPA: DUF885 domain-containing protein [Candidatus Limnocylindria bacterium]|nr:DUF885 domain-containing protein [Candidatus Limnocylindria bacterium]
MNRWMIALMLLGCVAAAPALAADGPDARFSAMAEEYLARWLARAPHVATRLGVHDGDALLYPVTEATVAEDVVWLKRFRSRLEAVPRARLSFDNALDRDVLAARIERELLNLEVIRPFERNPNFYLDLIAGSVQSLLQRNFASPCERIRSASRRLARVPEVLRAAKLNLRNPPKIYTEVAITQYQGALRFYREVVPALARGCKDSQAQAGLAEADSSAVKAVESFLAFLREDLLPASTGSYALGREVYQRKLAADEMETTPVDTLLAMAWAALEEHRVRMEALASQIAPGQGVAAALDSLEQERPEASQLVPFIAAQLDTIRDFLRQADVITMPAKENLKVRETPLFQRSLSFASMDSPGVWEKRATEAYYNVTPVDPSWTEQQKQDHLGFFNRYASEIVSIHEALPGHYYQFLVLKKVPSRLRQVLGAGSNVEGWAHYCEQMMLEQGYGGGDPRYQLAQLVLAIRRIGRFIAGISLHTQGMTYEQAVQLFQERCYMEPVNAEREARRGTSDPTYLVYTLGKWRILELRAEVKQRLGDRFRLKAFHDALLSQGSAALPVVRAGVLRELTGDATDRGE